MNQDERRRYLIKRLLKERPEYENIQISSDVVEQKMLLRSLMNIRMPGEMDHAFLQIQWNGSEALCRRTRTCQIWCRLLKQCWVKK